MEEGTFYGLTMKTPVIYAEIQVLLMFIISTDSSNESPGLKMTLHSMDTVCF